MTEELAKTYDPGAIEQRWYARWESDGNFSPVPDDAKQQFSIVLPPPNVTGALHMGHALNHTLQDILVRRARMKGFQALFLPGTDHAGIATQAVVERELLKQGTTRRDLGRQSFVEKVWQWKHEYGSRITKQMRMLGESCDWSRERFTMDDGLSRAVRTIFVRWFDDGLIYRGRRIINWCPSCQTALSDIEVEHKEVDGEIVTFRYPFADGPGSISVATTRVETMLGDTAVAVHPEDERYRGHIGRRVRHPFFPERSIPIVGDTAVDPEFGTGAVKVTPAHDPTDFEIGQRHELEQINVFDGAAHTTEIAGPFAGLDRYDARKRVLEQLQTLDLVERVERPYRHPVGHCYRSGTEIEPWLSDQWFVKMAPLAGPAIAAVRDGRIRFVPDRFAKQYTTWLENIRDWCISRQLWWGHRIPVWYCAQCGEAFAALEDPSECRLCGSDQLRQDDDVLDTWFSSQLWPFSTLGWPDRTPDLDHFYPTSVLVTGSEIIYLWVARMVFSALYGMGDVPFRDVFINGIVRDFQGKKMSKSLGNVIDPLEMIEKHGADALRFSLAYISVPGNDTNASEERVEGARDFANKLWNAARFIFLTVGEDRPALDSARLALPDRWILSRLDQTVDEVEAGLARYNTAEAMHALYSFVWNEFCDWYVEIAKVADRNDRGPAVKPVLIEVVDVVLRLLHPVMPFLTEELWSHLRPGSGSIMHAPWPSPTGRVDSAADDALDRFQDLVRGLRRTKIEHDVPPGQRIPAVIAPGAFSGELLELTDALVALARLGSLSFVDRLSQGDGARLITAAGIEAALRVANVVDPELEATRLERKLEEIEAEIARAGSKLANENFVRKAPAAVVQKERDKLAEHEVARQKLTAQLDAVRSR